MIYFTHYIPWNDDSRMTSGVKGIEDIETIFCRNGARLLPIPSKRRTHHLTPARRLALQRPILRTWQEACGPLLHGDALVILLPLHEKFGLLGRLIRSLKSRGIKVIFLAADLELARPATYSGLKRSYVIRQELSYLRQADGIITHNQAYTRLIQSRGITGPFMEFGLFDYLIPEAQLRKLQSRRNGGTPHISDTDFGNRNGGTPITPNADSDRSNGGTPRPDGPVIIATNLDPEKAGYAYRLPASTDFALYGPNYRPELQRSDGAFGDSEAAKRRPEDHEYHNASRNSEAAKPRPEGQKCHNASRNPESSERRPEDLKCSNVHGGLGDPGARGPAAGGGQSPTAFANSEFAELSPEDRNYHNDSQRSDPEDRQGRESLETYSSDDQTSPHITYGGAFEADDLIDHMTGSYGLLWDGPSPDTCAGPYGNYMRVNTPHRISLFLACGIPVIVWDQSAMAPLVLEHGLGFAVSSLCEIPAKRREISAGQYSEMAKKAWLMGARLRRGENTASILEKIRQL